MDEPEMKDDLEMDDEPGGRDSMYEEESHEEDGMTINFSRKKKRKKRKLLKKAKMKIL